MLTHPRKRDKHLMKTDFDFPEMARKLNSRIFISCTVIIFAPDKRKNKRWDQSNLFILFVFH